MLDLPGYDVATLVDKSGKSASHIYARLSLLQLIPEVAEAFTQERITASHANLIARLPQESQAEAFEQCWRKDWQDSEPHLLPAKHVSAWIQNNLYLALADAPFDREDPTLNPAAGACVTCPRRSGYNTSLFSDVTDGDQCLSPDPATKSSSRPISTARSQPVPSLSRSRTDGGTQKSRGPEPSSAATSARSKRYSRTRTPRPSRRVQQRNPQSSSTENE